MEGATQELGNILSAPPPGWHPPPGPANPIAILHASLEHLRNTGDEQYLFLRAILEVLHGRGFVGANGTAAAPLSGEEEQLLFHCATGLRHVMLFRWENYQPSFRACVRDLLLAVGLGLSRGGVAANGGAQTQHLPRTVTMACLSCASSFWKRGWTGTSSDESAGVQKDEQQSYLESLITNTLLPGMQRFPGDEAEELFGYVNSLLAAPFEQPAAEAAHLLAQRQYAAAMSASFLSLLVGEFTGGNSSARYNLPIEFHRLCHHLFESGSDDSAVSVNCKKSGLDATLNSSMTALSSLVGYILSSSSTAVQDESLLDLGSCIIDVTCDVLSWEFGAGASKWNFSSGSSRKNNNSVLLRPPQRWANVLINPEFLGAMFNVYSSVRVGHTADNGNRAMMGKQGRTAHLLRQLLLQLSSIAGPIIANELERRAYAGFLLDGSLNALESILNEQQQHGQLQEGTVASDLLSAEIVDIVTILSRLSTNFGIRVLSHLPSFPKFLSALCTTGKWLLESSLAECQRVEGDLEIMEGVDWRNDAVSQILQCSDAMADDYWLVSGTGGQEAAKASQLLASMLAPLYEPYCLCRTRMSCLEEHFMAREGGDLDEIREEISAFGLEEEMASAASLGRLNVLASMATLAGMFQQCMPKLMALFEGAGSGGDLSPDMAALLEEARMLLLCAGHLLTDDCAGETPAIPESVIHSCQGADGEQCTASISGLIEMLKAVAEAQAMKVASYPADPRLSPLLAKTLLWFFRRWGPAYILPSSDEYRENTGGILSVYSAPETAQPVVSFCSTLCLLYFCHWPQEKEVHDESTALLLALAKKGAFVRNLMVNSPSFEKIAALHSICASLRHNATQPEVAAAMAAVGGDLAPDVVGGYQRLPYSDRARVLTSLVISCSDMENEKATAMLNGCLKAVEAPFSALVQALGSKQANSTDIKVQESACLSILLYGGAVLAAEMSEPERIPHFINPSLPHLSGLMTFYAEDLTICEGLLKLFRDYAEQYIAMMTRDQCLNLFTSSASLLKHYSEHHCKNRVVRKKSEVENEFEEEQQYSDVMCAIQLLIHLGTKDFTSLCAASPSKGVETSQITDVIFFGLQQVLPLMTQGLLQFPTLCQHYFSLVGFMVETYPEKLCALPFDLFNALLDSLLFGMSHSDPFVAKSSLQGLASLAKEHIKTHALASHLSTKGDIVETCTRRLIQEVVFQPIIWDRLEPAGMALLPLAAIDVQKFIALVNAISQQLGSDSKQQRLHAAFEKLIKPEVLAKVAAEGREGRIVRVTFKKDFEIFVRDVNSFLITK
ncbi:hypothetical protein ACHAXT_007837 [Thalassiosira profunda]